MSKYLFGTLNKLYQSCITQAFGLTFTWHVDRLDDYQTKNLILFLYSFALRVKLWVRHFTKELNLTWLDTLPKEETEDDNAEGSEQPANNNTISKDNLTQFDTFPGKWYKSSDLETQRHIIDVCLTKVESCLRFDVRWATFLLRKLFLRTQLLLSNEKIHLVIIIPCSITRHYLVKKCDSFPYNKPK